MNILFVNCCTSDKEFANEFTNLTKKPEVSIQNYFRLLYKGLSSCDCKMFTLCERQVATSEKGLFLRGKKDRDEYCEYYYIPKLLIPGLSQFFSLIANFLIAIYWIRKFKPDYVVCDIMRYYISTPVRRAAKLLNIKCIGYAADLPQMYNHQSSRKSSGVMSTIKNVYSSAATKYDSYFVLSEWMNNLINPQNKPYIVIEGIVDTSLGDERSNNKKNSHRTVFMYSGGLHEKYGVRLLIDAVLNSKHAIELWLFGKGDQEDYLNSLNTDRIKYFGYQQREFVVERQRQADFLINPRFSDDEYTKYSFPSKIMEYMASKTPVISTRIKGIPNEYFKYIIPIESETIEGLLQVFEKCISLTIEERVEFGHSASRFVNDNKNCNIQAEKLFSWLLTQ